MNVAFNWIMEVFNIGLRGQKVTTDNRLGEIRKNTFGTEMKIIAYRKNDDIDIQFLDDNGYIFEHSTYTNFKNGQIKNPYDRTIFGVGYIGVGKYQTGLRKRTPEQYVWRGMLERCYCDRMKKIHPAYYGISTVCEEWLDFQVFAKWYNENIYQVGTERMHLDKDILIKGNKIYSPDTCLIVPQRINMLFLQKPNKYNLPSGISPMANNRYRADYNGKKVGNYDTLEEAIQAHDNEKRKAIKRVADEYKAVIPDKVYQALLAW